MLIIPLYIPWRIAIFVFMLVLILPGCSRDDAANDGLHTAVTADGVVLKLKRYRPEPETEFANGQPVLLFTGFMLNENTFLSHTPPERKLIYKKMRLPETLAPWAENDKHIQQDPMRYYSFAHYLWLNGYDVWLANVRGQGRGAFRSERGSRLSNLDTMVAFDIPAAVDKVTQVTGQAPVIGGHSTGALLAYLYFQGITIDVDTFLTKGYVPHVISDDNLVKERNAKLAGFIGFDPSGELNIITKNILNNPFYWTAIGTRTFINLDRVLGEIIEPLLPTAVNIAFIEVLFGIIAVLDEIFSPIIRDEVNVFGALNVWEVNKTNSFVEDFVARKVVTGFHLAVISQYADWGVHQTQREYWQNGQRRRPLNNKGPLEDDNFYRYNENMYKMSVPAVSVFSESPSLVDTNLLVQSLFDSKTHHPLDAWYEIEGSAHMDIVFSEDAPTIIFPLLGEWLDNLSP